MDFNVDAGEGRAWQLVHKYTPVSSLAHCWCDWDVTMFQKEWKNMLHIIKLALALAAVHSDRISGWNVLRQVSHDVNKISRLLDEVINVKHICEATVKNLNLSFIEGMLVEAFFSLKSNPAESTLIHSSKQPPQIWEVPESRSAGEQSRCHRRTTEENKQVQSTATGRGARSQATQDSRHGAFDWAPHSSPLWCSRCSSPVELQHFNN